MWEYQGCLMQANNGNKNRDLSIYTLNSNFPARNTLKSPPEALFKGHMYIQRDKSQQFTTDG